MAAREPWEGKPPADDIPTVRPSSGLGMNAREVRAGYADGEAPYRVENDADAYRGAWTRPSDAPKYDLTWPGMDPEERKEEKFREGLRNSEGFLTRPERSVER